MSFAFLPLYTGDYRRDTQHLSPLKHGVYLLLLFHCWDTRGPLPLDEQEMAGIANCRSSDEIEALRYVVRRFFVQMDDGHYNERMQREIERAEAISTSRSDFGRRGANERMRRLREAQAIAKQVLSKSLASDATPTTTTTSTTTTTKPKPSPLASLPADLVVSAEVWQQFREHRKAIRAPMTARAESLLARRLQELVASGENGTKVVEQSIERGWKGLFQTEGRSVAPGQKPRNKADRLAAINEEMWKGRKRDDAIDGTAERVG